MNKIKSKSLILLVFNICIGLLLLIKRNLFAFNFFDIIILMIFGILSAAGLIIFIYAAISKSFREKSQENVLKEWYHLKISLDVIFIIAMAVKFLFFQPYYVSGLSMEPTLHDANLLIVEKMSYYFHEPTRGDIVIFHYPKDPSKVYVKRIIGLPGEKIEIKNGQVTIYNSKNIQGMEIEENYLKNGVDTLGMTDCLLGNDEYFVMGDNRDPNASSDSREWGAVKENLIIGRAWLRVWPPGEFGTLGRPDYNLITSLFHPVATK